MKLVHRLILPASMVAAIVSGAFAVPQAAAMAGGGSSSTGTRSLAPQITCPSGWELAVDPATNKETCVRKTSEAEDTLPAVGWAGADAGFVEAAVLVHSGAYEPAIAAFTALGRPGDPYVLNYLGFANRKLGRVDAALAYYHKALALRPDYVRARSYLGEGYVALGRIEEAREQLALIEAECGTACEEYRVLETAIAEHLAKSNG